MKPQEMTGNQTGSQFYQTPPSLADRMLAGINWHMVETVLEPEASKGDLMYQITSQYCISRRELRDVLDLDYGDEFKAVTTNNGKSNLSRSQRSWDRARSRLMGRSVCAGILLIIRYQ